MFRRRARRRVTVLLPAPAGPSMAMTMARASAGPPGRVLACIGASSSAIPRRNVLAGRGSSAAGGHAVVGSAMELPRPALLHARAPGERRAPELLGQGWMQGLQIGALRGVPSEVGEEDRVGRG